MESTLDLGEGAELQFGALQNLGVVRDEIGAEQRLGKGDEAAAWRPNVTVVDALLAYDGKVAGRAAERVGDQARWRVTAEIGERCEELGLSVGELVEARCEGTAFDGSGPLSDALTGVLGGQGLGSFGCGFPSGVGE
jgi:hypothetical protein